MTSAFLYTWYGPKTATTKEMYLSYQPKLPKSYRQRMLSAALSVGLQTQSPLLKQYPTSAAEPFRLRLIWEITWVSTQYLLPFLARTAGLWAHHHIQQGIQVHSLLYVYLCMCIYICIGVEVLYNVRCIPVINIDSILLT